MGFLEDGDRMKSLVIVSCMFLSSAWSASADITAQEITGPNEYFFSSSTYYVNASATNASVEVDFIPGNRSWSGSVGYQTKDGSAVAGADYTAVSGTISWSGPALKNFNVPLTPTNCSRDRTIRLSLSIDTNSVSRCAEATLIIPAAPPVLSIAIGSNGVVRLSWPVAYTNYSVETIASAELGSGQWSPAIGAASLAGDQCVIECAVDGPSRFFRLRKQ